LISKGIDALLTSMFRDLGLMAWTFGLIAVFERAGRS
jgi:hypothetical protein